MMYPDLMDYIAGSVLSTVVTSDTSATLLVPSAGKRLRIFKIIVDSPDSEPPVVFFKDGA